MQTKISSITFLEKSNGEMAIDARYQIETLGSIPAKGFLNLQVDINDETFLEMTVKQLFDQLNQQIEEALSAQE